MLRALVIFEPLLRGDRFRVVTSGTGRVETVNVLPDGEQIRVLDLPRGAST